ncbi:hypothetical protein QAD02_022672 [Eretmocerus hayati]|uniref:Uncharacterized protein n=1 Tax=Eretmocerus hayati TaxID=131215 RepID=A0ACC2PV98_9HYME|nr:hypothetical protein QAD02_022672 [Eretmocerus hayati]
MKKKEVNEEEEFSGEEAEDAEEDVNSEDDWTPGNKESGGVKKRPQRAATKKHENDLNDTSGVPPKDFTSGAFVVAKADITGDKDPTLWRIDGKALLQKYLPFKEDGKTLYKSTSTYSGWSVNNKDKYIAAQVTFKLQSRQETIVELHLDAEKSEQTAVKDEKEE